MRTRSSAASENTCSLCLSAPGAGAIGRVRAVGPDATRLAVGDWVSCDPTVRSRDDALTPDITLQGWSARGDGGLRLQKHFHHGSFAEQMLVPTENVFPLGLIDPKKRGDDGARSNLLLVPYGGLLAANFKAGETLLVSGATGNFGSAAVAVALAMGAGCVICPGRNEAMLDELKRRFGFRVRTLKLTGDEDGRSRANQAGGAGPDRLRPGPAAALRRHEAGTGRRDGGARIWQGRVDGRRWDAGR